MPRPYVLLSVAQSIDGFIDDTSPQRLVLSSPEDLDRVDEVRAGCDAIMIGATTLRRDNPRLRIKSAERRAARVARGLPEELLRVIVTRTGQVNPDLRIWGSDGDKIIYCPDAAASALRAAIGNLAVIAPLGVQVDFAAMLDDLGERGVERLMVEGGEQIHTEFLLADLADEVQLTIGGFFVGDQKAPRFVTPGIRLPQSPERRMRLAEVSRAGETAVLRYLVQRHSVLSLRHLRQGACLFLQGQGQGSQQAAGGVCGAMSRNTVAIARKGEAYPVYYAVDCADRPADCPQHYRRQRHGLRWTSWYRWVTLAMLAAAVLTIAAAEATRSPAPDGLIPPTRNEIAA